MRIPQSVSAHHAARVENHAGRSEIWAGRAFAGGRGMNALPLALLASLLSLGSVGDRPRPPKPPPMPPPEAVAACSGKSAGDACAFTFQSFDVEGSCRTVPVTTGLVCVP